MRSVEETRGILIGSVEKDGRLYHVHPFSVWYFVIFTSLDVRDILY